MEFVVATPGSGSWNGFVAWRIFSREAAPAAFFSHRCLDFVGRLRDFVIAVEAASFDNAPTRIKTRGKLHETFAAFVAGGASRQAGRLLLRPLGRFGLPGHADSRRQHGPAEDVFRRSGFRCSRFHANFHDVLNDTF
jgi:hypothetical protein